MRRRITAIISTLALLLVLVVGSGVSVVTAESDTSLTSWFADAGYGVMVHFLNRSQNTASAPMSGGASTSWDNCVNEFDVEAFADQIEQTGAGYVLFTLQQIDAYFCAPNATYDALVEQSGAEVPADFCSDRDLPAELADALAAKGIKLMLYATADGPWSNETVYEQVLGGEIDDTTKQPVLTDTFKANWQAIIEEYAERYGDKIAGWWIDGADTSKWTVAELNVFGSMLKTHNTKTIVAFNQGGDTREPGYDGASYVAIDDYTAGEHHAFDAYPTEQYVSGKQWHLLSYLWGGTERGFVEYTADEIIDYVSAVMEKKGVVTLDISVGRTGDIVSAEMDVLKKLSDAIRGVTPAYDFEIIQDFSDSSTYTRNSKWSRGMLNSSKSISGTLDSGATYMWGLSTEQEAAGVHQLNGTSAMALRMQTGEGWGSSHLINSTLPAATIEGMSGIFFRMWTDVPTDVALSLSTVGAGTTASGVTNSYGTALDASDYDAVKTGGSGGSMSDAYALTKNSDNIRYYNTDGELVSTGRVLPANFNGWIFVEVEDWDSYTKDGLTINYTDSDYSYVTTYAPSIAGSSNKWALSDLVTVVIDDVGYYAVSTADTDDNYQSIIDDIVNPKASSYYEFQIIQNFDDSSTYTRNGMWSRGMLTTVKNTDVGYTDGAAHISQMSTTQISNGEHQLNGTTALALNMLSAGRGWGASHLVNDSLPAVTMSNMSGIFFRMKTNTTYATALSVTTVGAGTEATGTYVSSTSPAGTLLTNEDRNDHNVVGNAGALLDEYSITKDSDNIRYYNTSGELVATGRAVPAAFDGWIFIEVADWDSYTKDGLTINWIDSDYDYVTTYVSEIGGSSNKWCRSDATTSVVIDDVGYYAVGSAELDDNYQSIIDDIVNPKVSSYYEYQIIQNFNDGTTYTRNGMWSRGMLTTVKNTDVGYTDGAAHISQMSTTQIANGEHQLNGTALALSMLSAGRGWGASHLVNHSLPAVTMSNMSGIFFRMRTDTTYATALSVTTVGAGTEATGTYVSSTSPAGTLLTNEDKNDHNVVGNAGALLDEYSITKDSDNIRYYNTSGELVATGRAVPAAFDGWIFIEVADWDSYTKDGLTINWIDSDYDYVTTYVSEIGGSSNKWCRSDAATSVAIDDVGYYAVGTANADGNYQSIIEEVAGRNSYSYEIFQEFDDATTYKQNSLFTRGLLGTSDTILAGTGGNANIYSLLDDTDADADSFMYLDGTAAFSARMISAGRGWGASHLMRDALPESTLESMSGIFFRFKTNTQHKTALSVTTVGINTEATGTAVTTTDPAGTLLSDSDKNSNNAVGNAGALLDQYSLTKNTDNIRYYDVNGELQATGRAVPAGFDGWIFIEIEGWDAYANEGLTINWIDSDYEYVNTYVPSIAGSSNKWCLNDGTFTKVAVDHLGYFCVSNATADAEYTSIINDWNAEYIDTLNEKMQVSCEARGFDTSASVGADWLADYAAAMNEVTTATAATSVYDTYRSQMAMLGNVLRLNVGGRQVRTDDTTLRFILEIDQDFLSYMESKYTNVEFGTLLARSDLYTGEMLEVGQTKFSKNSATTVPRLSTYTPDNYDAVNDGDTLVYTCVVRNIPSSMQETAVRARSYLKYTDGNGAVIVLYGEERQATYADTLAQA